MQLDIPQSLVMPDGTTALVKAVTAQVIDGALHQIVYTVERENGAWAEVSSQEVQINRQDPDHARVATADADVVAGVN